MRVDGPPSSCQAIDVRNAITGIATCCARAANGHNAPARPSSVMNSRLRMSSMEWLPSPDTALRLVILSFRWDRYE